MRKEIAGELLGVYLLCLALVQAVVYVFMVREPNPILLHLDPRLGILFFCDMLRLPPLVARVLSWFSVLILAGIGIVQISGRSLLRTYIVFEVICGVPTIIVHGILVAVNVSLAFRFTNEELLFLLPVLLSYTVIPLIWAIRLLRSSPTQPDDSQQIDFAPPAP